jgi:transcriptional regulator with XRE-family HTH domain
MLGRLAGELRDARVSAGVSQTALAREARMTRSKAGRYESGRDESATIVEMCVLLATAGVGFRVSTYPLGDGPRDEASAARLAALLRHVGPPLTWRTEVLLPNPDDHRAWDAHIDGNGRRSGVEFEMKLGDLQALARRTALKRRAGGVECLLLVIADTRHNRQVLRDHPTFMPELARLRSAG